MAVAAADAYFDAVILRRAGRDGGHVGGVLRVEVVGLTRGHAGASGLIGGGWRRRR